MFNEILPSSPNGIYKFYVKCTVSNNGNAENNLKLFPCAFCYCS